MRSPPCDCLVVTAPVGAPIFVGGQMIGKGPRVVIEVKRGEALEVFAVIGGKMDRRVVTFPAVKPLRLGGP